MPSEFRSRGANGAREQRRIGILAIALLFLFIACAPGAKLAPVEPASSTNSTPPTSDTPSTASTASTPSDPSTTADRADSSESTDSSDPKTNPEPETSTPKPEEDEKTKSARKLDERKQRRRILLKTAYDDRTLGEEQTSIVEAEMGLYKNEELESYVHSVAVRLLRHAPPQPFEYEFKIVDQTVPNAFALPGGKIYVSRGLLALVGSEDELAAVLGHEITHAAERHAAARIEHASRINPLAIGFMRAANIAAYGREHERDADRGGQILAAKAGYNPNGIATFLKKLDAFDRYEIGWSRLPSFLATHPTSPERSALAAQRASDLTWVPAPTVASTSGQPLGYAGMIDGLILGDDPAGGLFKDARFVHPDMRFSLRFPPRWTTQNSPQAVSAVSPSRDAEASLSAAGVGGDLDRVVDDFLAEEVDGVQIRVLDRRPIKIGDLPAIRIEGRAPGLHAVMAFLDYEGVVFRLSLLSIAGLESRYRGRANAFIQSFRPLDEEGIYSLEIRRLRLARALPGETLAQLSERTHNDLELVYTGVLNDLFASTELSKGQVVKIGLSEPYLPAPREDMNDSDPAESDGSDSRKDDVIDPAEGMTAP